MCDNVFVVHVPAGPPRAVLSPGLLRRVFGVDAEVIRDPRHGTPLCVTYGLAEHALAPAVPIERWGTAAISERLTWAAKSRPA